MAYTFNPFTGTFDNTGTPSTVSTILTAISAQIAETLYANIHNADSVTLNRGDVVYSFGATGDTMSVKRASNSSEATSSKTLGFVNETIAPGARGTATVAGRMDKLAFGTPFADGDQLWLDATLGQYTRVKPIAPNHSVYLGVVERANLGNGLAYIKVQNGYELNEIHDVLITTPLSGQIIRRNGANTLWENTNDLIVSNNGVFINGGQVVVTNTTTVPAASSVKNIITLTETDYNAISVKDAQTLYIVV